MYFATGVSNIIFQALICISVGEAMPYAVKPLAFKPPHLKGLSERLLASHYENNYGGAVRRLNAIEARLKSLDLSKATVFDLNGLGRERLIAANSMILHEVYFDGLGGTGGPVGTMAAALERDFGSVDNWSSQFTAMGKAQGGGAGWVVLTWSPRLGRLSNQWAADHAHILADGIPILALDMYEHAYHLDFGAKAAAYVDSFMGNIHWARVEKRYSMSVHNSPAQAADNDAITAETLHAALDRGDEILLLDVCLAEDLAKRTDILPGALIRPPEEIDTWSQNLPANKLIVVYCVYGFQVSGDAVAELRRKGLNVKPLAGGIAAWHAMGGPTVPLLRNG
jgi:Fe-Mn family superoxide dismutase